jgi:hypothetical protein
MHGGGSERRVLTARMSLGKKCPRPRSWLLGDWNHMTIRCRAAVLAALAMALPTAGQAQKVVGRNLAPIEVDAAKVPTPQLSFTEAAGDRDGHHN